MNVTSIGFQTKRLAPVCCDKGSQGKAALGLKRQSPNEPLCSSVLHKPITSQHITSFISYVWMAPFSREHGISHAAHSKLTVCNDAKRQEKLYWLEIYYCETRQREKKRECEGEGKMSPLLRWYYLGMWQLLQSRMKDAGGTELHFAWS